MKSKETEPLRGVWKIEVFKDGAWTWVSSINGIREDGKWALRNLQRTVVSLGGTYRLLNPLGGVVEFWRPTEASVASAREALRRRVSALTT